MTIAVLQIGFMETDGTVTKFILNESGNLFLCLQATAKHDDNVPNFNHWGEHIRLVSRLINYSIGLYQVVTNCIPFYHQFMTRVVDKVLKNTSSKRPTTCNDLGEETQAKEKENRWISGFIIGT